jgi:hypothetical protein
MKALIQLIGMEETAERVLALHRTWILVEDGQPSRRPGGCGPNISMGPVAVVVPDMDPKDLLQGSAAAQETAGFGTVAQR